MAQLRDANTSELIAEGTPSELVALADALGRDEVLFDDVGEGFDPDAVRQAALDRAEGLEGAAADAKGKEAERLKAAAEAARGELALDPDALEDAKRRQEAARQRADEAR